MKNCAFKCKAADNTIIYILLWCIWLMCGLNSCSDSDQLKRIEADLSALKSQISNLQSR